MEDILSASAHLKHHWRLYVALVLGLAAFRVAFAAPLTFRLIVAGDIFFASYLLLIGLVLGSTSEDLRNKACVEDEGIVLVVLIVLTAIVFCCYAVLEILHQNHGRLSPALFLALAGAPLGWLALHVVAAFHYANLYYGPGHPVAADKKGQRPALLFPGVGDPEPWDFLYYAFVIGMTAQVSDVQVADTKMRRATLGHGVVSFFFNTVLIAMAVNAVVTIAV